MKKIVLFMLLLAVTGSSMAQEAKYQLSSHILDITRGEPASGVKIMLSKLNSKNEWVKIEEKITDKDGRIKEFLKEEKGGNNKGIYKLTYFTKPYFDNLGQNSFYPFIDVVFEIQDNNHYHVPITLSAYGYSTYRGS